MKRSFILSPYAKAFVAFVIGCATFIGGLVVDGEFGIQDGIALAGWLGVTFGVYQVPNREDVEVGGA